MNFGNQVDRIKQKPAAKAKHEKKAKKNEAVGGACRRTSFSVK